MEIETFKKAYCLAESLDACDMQGMYLIMGERKNR